MAWVFQYVGKDGCHVIRDVELYSSEEAALRRAREWEAEYAGKNEAAFRSKREFAAYDQNFFRTWYKIFQREVKKC